MKPIPVAEPSATNGQYVNCQIQSAKNDRYEENWKLVSTITKGQTDTFAFLLFSFPQFLDLSNADLLSFDTWVPAGQSSNARLIIMVHSKDSSDYYVETGRMLNAPGYQKITIPIDRFQLAAWSTANSNQLNTKQIDRIVIGWGGYFGNVNERLEFTSSAPKTGKYLR
jgi:hypothetical protein